MNSHSSRQLCFTVLDDLSFKPLGSLRTIELDRSQQDVKLLGLTMNHSKDDASSSSLITIWSDRRVFEQKIKINENNNNLSIGNFHSMIDCLDGKSEIAMECVGKNYIAIYASKPEAGSHILLFNIKYKIVKSKLPFKVFLDNVRLWSVHENLYLSMGSNLSVIPFVVTEDKLSSMIGSQSDTLDALVEKENINEQYAFEDAIVFDDNQDIVEGMECHFGNNYFNNTSKSKILSGAKNIIDSDELRSNLNDLYRQDLLVDVVRLDEQQPKNTASIKLMSNIDENFPLMGEEFEVYCTHLEKYGCSEIEITNKVVPILIKSNRTEDLGLIMKRYNNVSERMLIQIIKYLLNCPNEENGEFIDDEGINDMNMSDSDSFDENKIEVVDKKFRRVNAFLNTNQDEKRDVLSIALCCAFDSATILKYINSDINLEEMIQLMDHLYKILSTDVLDDMHDMRGNLVEGNDFDLDTKLFEWFKLLIDSHYQQILLSKDAALTEKMEMWLKLLDDHIRVLNQMNALRPVLTKIASNKSLQPSKKCNQWYTIEKLNLY
jgi:hypothetical protein